VLRARLLDRNFQREKLPAPVLPERLGRRVKGGFGALDQVDWAKYLGLGDEAAGHLLGVQEAKSGPASL